MGSRELALLPAPHSLLPPMPAITIYTTAFCPYCHMAKRLLTQKGASFEEIDVTGDRAARAELRAKAGGRTTVPQIWIGELHVGGSAELSALERDGKLDALLAG
jgi:glutaredoxin 3